jgi:hypothetical protein
MRLLYVVTLACILLVGCRCQIATPVMPCYNTSMFDSFYSIPLMKTTPTLEEFIKRQSVGYHHDACFRGTHKVSDGHNAVIENFSNVTELRSDPNFLWGTTYWLNEFLHVGHVMYDVALIQLLELVKIDRIVLQRAVCHGMLCAGIGSMESFYKGYFAAMFSAFNQPMIPVYLRWSGRETAVTPMYFSAVTEDNYYNMTDPIRKVPIQLNSIMCFEKVFRRTDTNFGAKNVLGPTAVEKFRESAYKLITKPPLLRTKFVRDAPFRILLSYRGPQASRHIENIDILISLLHKNFPLPSYEVHTLNNSNPQLDYKTQLRAVAEAHVVITNHGAFQGNMLYMRKDSLMLEIFGHYGNNEIHQFHRLALNLGVYYARVQPRSLTDHQMRSYQLAEVDMDAILNITQDYFVRRPFLNNLE